MKAKLGSSVFVPWINVVERHARLKLATYQSPVGSCLVTRKLFEKCEIFPHKGHSPEFWAHLNP